MSTITRLGDCAHWPVGGAGEHVRRSRGGFRPIPAARPAAAAAEAADLGGLQNADPAALEAVDPDRADPDADEPLDRCLHCPEHPAQLTLPALAQSRPIPMETSGRPRMQEVFETLDLDIGHRPEVLHRRDPLLELDATLERLDLLVRERRTHGESVFALDPEPRMQDLLGPAAVVR